MRSTIFHLFVSPLQPHADCIIIFGAGEDKKCPGFSGVNGHYRKSKKCPEFNGMPLYIFTNNEGYTHKYYLYWNVDVHKWEVASPEENMHKVL